jgi:hypothetical protein
MGSTNIRVRFEYILHYPSEFAHVNAGTIFNLATNAWGWNPHLTVINLLIGNNYFPPDTKPEAVANYFHLSEWKLDVQMFQLLGLGILALVGPRVIVIVSVTILTPNIKKARYDLHVSS